MLTGQIATGEARDSDKPDPSAEANRKGGQIGGKARADSPPLEERKAIALKAAAAQRGKTASEIKTGLSFARWRFM
ncbi:hypothetical protein ERY430_41438 [Erythrobacter sp. EC-HK427]|nr:hypothetical protein ERY430_41438 [Erythrobacter sp. EC-HK427]